MPSGILGQGTTIGYSTTGESGTFTDIDHVGTISGPTTTASTVDTTAMDSVGGYNEFISGLIDPGSVSFSVNFDPALANHQQMFTFLEDQGVSTVHWKITFSDAATTTCIFAGVVTGAEVTAPIDGALQLAVSVKVTGAVDWPGTA